MEATVYSINGPVVKIKDVKTFQMLEMVYVGNSELMGEVIKIDDHYTTIQVYESTTSVKVGEPVYKTNNPLSATLGPGILSNIFDGIERPLKEMAKTSGMFVSAGRGIDSLDDKRKWDVTFIVKKGDV
jgi:V/A-type H+-transporting ATPase subunit A